MCCIWITPQRRSGRACTPLLRQRYFVPPHMTLQQRNLSAGSPCGQLTTSLSSRSEGIQDHEILGSRPSTAALTTLKALVRSLWEGPRRTNGTRVCLKESTSSYNWLFKIDLPLWEGSNAAAYLASFGNPFFLLLCKKTSGTVPLNDVS